MLTKFTLANFKSFRQATLELAPMTVLVGANASGKSNALEGLQLLSWLSRGRRLDEVFRGAQDSEVLLRGSITDLLRSTGPLVPGREGKFQLGCGLRHETSWDQLKLEIKVDDNGLRIIQEQILSPAETLPLYNVQPSEEPHSHDLIVSYNNFSQGRNKPQITCTNQQAVFTQLLTPARFADKHERSQKEIPWVSRAFMDALQGVLFLDPSPRRMRGYSFIVDRSLKGDGSNLSSTLYDLCDRQQKKDDVLAFVRDLPEQDITNIEFLLGPRAEVMLQLEESFGNAKTVRDAPVLSDGTLRVMAVATAMLSAPVGSTVVVEEIDNGVHPSRARKLLANIEHVASERRLKVLLTSHNPALLDALPLSAVPSVTFCFRDPTEGDSRLIKLSELADYPELVAQGPLGELVTKGILDRLAKNPRNPEERVQAMLEWIDNLGKPAAAA
jgi:predicted ATPase